MSDKRGPGRGRGRGDQKPPPPQQQQQQQPQQQSAKPLQPPALQGAWAQRSANAPGRASHTGVPTAKPSVGRTGSARPTSAPSQAAPTQPIVQQTLQPRSEISAGGGGDANIGRGSIRGRKFLSAEILKTRPSTLVSKQGTLGRPLQLQANYFKLLTTTDWCLYKYRVDFAPEEDRIFARKGMLYMHRDKIGGYIFDGTVLYTSHRLPEPMEFMSTRRSDDAQIRISIRIVGDMVVGDEHYLQFYNIIMRKCLQYLKLQLVGKDYYDAGNKIEVRQYKLELWPGYETSIRQHESSILMCAEIRHKVMRQQTLLDILKDCFNRYPGEFQERFKAMVVGVTVLTDYNNRTYRIDDVDFSQSPMSTFTKKGETITFCDYYRAKYQINIRDCKQPLLLSKNKDQDRRAGSSEIVSLVPELCRSTGLTDDMRNDHTMMRELAVHTRLDPKGRIGRLMSFNQRLHNQPDVVKELSTWNMKLDKQLVSLPGRRVDPQNIIFGRGAIVNATDSADWQRALRDKPLHTVAPLKSWVLITPSRSAREADLFVGTLKSSVRSMNFPIEDPQRYDIPTDRPGDYTTAIEKIMSQSNPQLIFCVLPNNRADRYSAIKKKCCIDRPVPTQCMLFKNLAGKNSASIATKVGIQMNCKIGGAPWTVEIPAPGLMVAGFDVCHDTNNRERDFGALVASLNPTYTRYFSAVSAHTTGEELSNDLATNMVKALQKFKEVNNALPSRIVFYRDGVGEGQIPFVYEHEVQRLRMKMAEVYGNPALVRLAYIIVTKRLNTRLFCNGSNPPAGTIVDDVITSPLKYDFFIVSQFVRQGSVSPTGYNVISDNVDLDASRLQVLSFKLTHMYFNWSGTVRVPAPCQLAHKLAFLVSQSLHASPSNHLETLLYYL